MVAYHELSPVEQAISDNLKLKQPIQPYGLLTTNFVIDTIKGLAICGR